jgi:hypothetical protein
MDLWQPKTPASIGFKRPGQPWLDPGALQRTATPAERIWNPQRNRWDRGWMHSFAKQPPKSCKRPLWHVNRKLFWIGMLKVKSLWFATHVYRATFWRVATGSRRWGSHVSFGNNFVNSKLGRTTVDGRNPAPVDRWFIPLFIGFQPSKVVQDFFHQQKETFASGCWVPNYFRLMTVLLQYPWRLLYRMHTAA